MLPETTSWGGDMKSMMVVQLFRKISIIAVCIKNVLLVLVLVYAFIVIGADELVRAIYGAG